MDDASDEVGLVHWKAVAEDLQRLIETANAPIFGIDTHGNVTDWNRKTAAITGFSKAEAIGKHLVETFIHADHRASVHEILSNALKGEECANYEMPLFTKDGDRREILLNATTRRGADGGVIGVVGMGQDITEIRAVSAERHRVADDLSRLIETANAPIFGVDLNGMVNEWNRKAADMLGYTKGESIGRDLVNHFIQPENRRSVSEVLRKALAGVETANYELPLLSKIGKEYTVLLNATTRRDVMGQVTGVVGVGQDITEVKQAMAESKRVADDLRRLIDTANAPIIGIDTEGNVTEWNAKASSLLQYSKPETIGKNLVENFISKEFKDRVDEVLKAALRGTETANFEFPLFTKNGARIDILLNATTRRGPDGEVIGVIGVGQDITQIHAITAERERVADDLSRLIDNANAPIFGVDLRGMVTEWNKKAADILGYTKDEAIGKNLVASFIQPENRQSVDEVLHKAMTGDETANYELPLMSKLGKRYTVLLNATTRRDAKGHVTGVVGVGQDITALNQVMAESKRVADDLTRLIQTANAPIFGIDTEGKVTEWNAKASSLLGLSKVETMGKHLVTNFIKEEFKESVNNVLMAALKGHETANFEFPLFTKDLKRIDILLNATTRRGPDGEVIGVIGVGQDITQFRAITAEQQRVADDLSRLIENANAPIFGVDLDGMVTEWNRKAADMLGYTKDSAIGRHLVEDFILPENRRSVDEVLQKALSGVETANYELPLKSKNGKRYTVLLNATTRRDAKGLVTGVVGVGQDITELNQVMAQSARVADDLTRLIETANAPIFGIDTEGKVTEWNAKASSLLGLSKVETMGKHLVTNFIEEEFKESVNNVLMGALKGRETANFEFPLFTKDLKRIDILLNATTRRGPDGEVIGVIGVGQDITELNQVLAESKRVADDLTRLIETANAPIFGIDTEGKVTEWNAKASSLLGFSKPDTMGKHLVSNFIEEEFKDSVNNVLLAALNGHETANFEFPLFTKDLKRIDILLNATTRRGPEGEVIGVIGVGQDITQFRAITAEQHRVADDLSRLIENANAPIFGVDLNGMVTEWNLKAADMLGYTKDAAIGKHLVEGFILPENRRSVDEVLQKALSGVETANYELPLKSKNGKRYTVLLNATTRRDARGLVTGVVGVGQDITELNKVMAEAKRVADDLTRLIETANAPIFGINTAMKVTEWNAKASSLLGLSKAETMGKHLVTNFIKEEFKESVNNVLLAALNGHETANFEFPLFTKDMKRIDILLNATTRRGPEGEVIGVIGVGQDITQFRAITAEQHRVADDLSRLIENANAPIFGVDLNGMVTEWNLKAADMLGYTKDAAIGKRLVEDFILPENRRSVNEVLQKALCGVETANYELPLKSKNGKLYTVLLNATTRRDAKGHVTGVVGVGQDITELNQVLVESKRVANDLTRLIETANAPIFGIDTEGKVTEWNAKASSLLGFSKPDTMGKHLVANFIEEEFKESVNNVLLEALKGHETANFEFPLFTKDLKRIDILLNATTRRGPDGEVVGVIGVGQDITQFRAITAEQQRVADDLSRLIENANAPIFGVNLDGMVTEWNRKAADMLGYTKEAAIGKHLVEDFILPENRRSVNEVLQKARSGVETANYELPLKSKNGKRYTVLLNANTRRDAKGHIIGVVGVGQDITELNQVMAESKRVAGDLTRLIETANAPIFGIDTEGNVSEWNAKASSLIGYSKVETMGKSLVNNFITEEFKHRVSGVLNSALKGNETANFEFPLFTKKGERIDILLNATTRRGPDGEVTGVIGVGQDITGLNKHRQKAERIAEDLFRLIDTANAPIFGVDKDKCIKEWNGWVSRKSGFSKTEVLGKKLEAYIAGASRALVHGVFDEAIQGKATSNFEVQLLVKRQQKPVCLLLNATPRLSSQGDIVGVICVGQDITNIKDVENKKSSFMAMVSHELKSPLHGIIGLSSTMVEASSANEAVRRPLKMIHGCAMRLLDMVSNIMDASVLVQEKKMRLTRDSVHMNNIVEEVIVLCRHSIDKRGNPIAKEGVQLINDMPQLPTIEADSHRCTQLIYNLVTNALKFTHKGHVRVLAEVDKDRQVIIFTVEDTGIGIAPENLERIFQPFDQEDQSETRHYEGLGLGLAICREVATKHGGSLTVDSEKNKGSKFHVTLPFKMQSPDIAIDPVGAEKQTSQDLPTSVSDVTYTMYDMHDDESENNAQRDSFEPRSYSTPGGEHGCDTETDDAEGASHSNLSHHSFSNCRPLGPYEPRTQDTLDHISEEGDIDNIGENEHEDDIHRRDKGKKTFDARILSVDDDEVNQEVIRAYLRTRRYKVDVVMNGDDCLRYMENCKPPPDLILLDLMMPGISGMDVLSELRKQYSVAQLPIIMVSAKSSSRAVAQGLALQCNDWVHKPIDRLELLARIDLQIMLKAYIDQLQMSLRVHEPLLQSILPKDLKKRIEQCLETVHDISEEELNQFKKDLRLVIASGSSATVSACAGSDDHILELVSQCRAELAALNKASPPQPGELNPSLQDKLASAAQVHALELRSLEQLVSQLQRQNAHLNVDIRHRETQLGNLHMQIQQMAMHMQELEQVKNELEQRNFHLRNCGFLALSGLHVNHASA